MLDIPYIGSPKNACALACYTMVAKYFFPETTFEQIAEISNWEPGYLVWGYKFWSWITHKGIKVTDYDLIDLESWVAEGRDGLKKSVSKKEFDYINSHTKDLNGLTQDIIKLDKNNNFVYHRQKPTMDLLYKEITNRNPAEVVLDSHTLDKKEGFALHRVVVTDIDDKEITFHDPRETPRPNRVEPVEDFENAWLQAVSEPELCIYSKVE